MKLHHRGRRGTFAAAAVTITGLTAAATAVFVPSAAAGEGGAYAYGIYADGLIDVPQTPYVETGDEPQKLVDVSLPEDNPALHVGALETWAKKHHAKARALHVKLGSGGQLPEQLRDKVPQQLSEQLPEGSAVLEAKVLQATCDGGEGDTKVVGLEAGGHMIPPEGQGDVPANTTIAVPPKQADAPGPQVASVTLNKQVKQDDGSLTVTALQVKLLTETPGEQVVNISQVHCGEQADYPGPGETETPGPSGPKAPKAPAPEPVPGDFSVTG